LPVAGSRPSGVFSAGAAQKMINLGGYDIGNRFVILGSGDVGLIVARELAARGKEVIAVIEKEEKCGSLARNRINCLEKYNIPLITSATVSKVHGIDRVSGVTVQRVPEIEGGELPDEGCDEWFIACDTLITSVGLIPERDLLDGFSASIPEWVFLSGNASFVHDFVDDVTIESERTGQQAAEFVQKLHCHEKVKLTTNIF
jgi:NADPH-dependent 2,4-dienoyl-CoA reductase/sulfur reductase-like enzyme